MSSSQWDECASGEPTLLLLPPLYTETAVTMKHLVAFSCVEGCFFLVVVFFLLVAAIVSAGVGERERSGGRSTSLRLNSPCLTYCAFSMNLYFSKCFISEHLLPVRVGGQRGVLVHLRLCVCVCLCNPPVVGGRRGQSDEFL